MNSDNVSLPPKTPQEKKPFRTRLWNWTTDPSKSLENFREQRYARLAASFLLVITVLTIVGAIARAARLGAVELLRGGPGFSIITSILAYALSRTKWYQTAIFIFAIGFSSTAYTTALSQGTKANFALLTLLYLPVSLILLSTFLSHRPPRRSDSSCRK